jgi:hypothetical protein
VAARSPPPPPPPSAVPVKQNVGAPAPTAPQPPPVTPLKPLVPDVVANVQTATPVAALAASPNILNKIGERTKEVRAAHIVLIVMLFLGYSSGRLFESYPRPSFS